MADSITTTPSAASPPAVRDRNAVLDALANNINDMAIALEMLGDWALGAEHSDLRSDPKRVDQFLNGTMWIVARLDEHAIAAQDIIDEARRHD